MGVLMEGVLDRTIMLFGSNADPGPDLTWARGVTLLAYDGAGSSPHPGGPTAVVGWSVAGRHALAFAARNPDLVDRIALVATPIPDEETLPFVVTDINAKTLLLFGTKDPMTGARHGTWWQRQLPNARLEMYPDGSHDLLQLTWKRVLSHLAPRCRR